MIAFVFVLFMSQARAKDLPRPDNKTSYKDFQMWRLHVENKNLTEEFEEKLAKQDVFHRWDNNIDFLLNGNETEYWNRFLESQNISYAVLLDDVQRAIEKEDLMKKYGGWRRGGKINWVSYAKLNDVYDYVKSVAAANPSYCTIQSIGKTSQRRDIQMLKLSTGKATNNAYLLEAGMHGREWVAVSSLLYFIEQIAWNFTSQPDHIKNKDWYIIPVSNPDGYEYSMTKDRMWRKNRRRFSGECDGVDVNRNFDVNWGGRGASNSICSVAYCGPEPFSEAESIAIKNVATGRHFTGYVGVHSYGSRVFFPWAHSGRPTDRADAHIVVAKNMVMAMREVAKEHFRAGTINQLQGIVGSGLALDWMFLQGVPHTYLLETRGAKSGAFLLEANQILPAAKEVTAGLHAMARTIV